MSPDQLINTRLLMHPVNWLIVWSVMLFMGFAWMLTHDWALAAPMAPGGQSDAAS